MSAEGCWGQTRWPGGPGEERSSRGRDTEKEPLQPPVLVCRKHEPRADVALGMWKSCLHPLEQALSSGSMGQRKGRQWPLAALEEPMPTKGHREKKV